VVGIPAHLWDESGPHRAKLDPATPNVNDSRLKSVAPPKAIAKTPTKSRRTGRLKEGRRKAS